MATRTYKSQNEKVPSVTTVLSKFKDPGPLMYWAWKEGTEGRNFRDTAQQKASIGSLAHAMIDAKYKGGKLEIHDSTDPEILFGAQHAFEAFEAWADSIKLNVLATEVAMVHSTLKFGGTFDAVAKVDDGSLVVIDWKSSKGIYQDHIVQLGAYALLVEEGVLLDDGMDGGSWCGRPVEGLIVLRIDREGLGHTFLRRTKVVVDTAKEQFKLFRQAYENLSLLAKAAK